MQGLNAIASPIITSRTGDGIGRSKNLVNTVKDKLKKKIDVKEPVKKIQTEAIDEKYIKIDSH